MFTLEQQCNAFNNGTISSTSLESAGAGITGGYDGNSLTLLVLIIVLPSLSMYNAIELVVLIFFTFNKYKGVYFWSILVASLGIIPYSLGFLFKFANITTGETRWLSVVLLTIGWWTMVTGQSVVLWSRLHLLLEGQRGQRILQWSKWIIIVDAIILHVPTTVLTFGSNGQIGTATFARGYSIMEKIQMSGFFLQEVVLSSIYIMGTLRILRTSIRDNTKRLMWQLMFINIVIIIMDMALLGLEAASLYLLETLIKGVIYSVKLKLEFAILGRLVQFVGRPGTSIGNEERARKASVTFFGHDVEGKTSRDTARSMARNPSDTANHGTGFGPGFVSDFTELVKARTNTTHNTHNSGQRRPSEPKTGSTGGALRTRAESLRLPPGMTIDDVNVAMFQHTSDNSLPGIETQDRDANVSPSAVRSTSRLVQSYVGDEAV